MFGLKKTRAFSCTACGAKVTISSDEEYTLCPKCGALYFSKDIFGKSQAESFTKDRKCAAPPPKKAKISTRPGKTQKAVSAPTGKKAVILVFLVIGILTSIGWIGSRADQTYYRDGDTVGSWDTIELHGKLPAPPDLSDVDLYMNTVSYLTFDVCNATEEDYLAYCDACETSGFSEVCPRDAAYSYRFTAADKDGYRLAIYYQEDRNFYDVSLDAPYETITIVWPTSGPASAFPAPPTDQGIIQSLRDDYCDIILAGMSLDDVRTYAASLEERGAKTSFSFEPSNGWKWYGTFEGCSATLQYLGADYAEMSFIPTDDTDGN